MENLHLSDDWKIIIFLNLFFSPYEKKNLERVCFQLESGRI